MDTNQKLIADEAVELERQFRANRWRGAEGNPFPLVRKGNAHIVISAPHAVIHYRDGRKKLNEPYTGALALQLHERTGASTIINASTTTEDPNWDKTSVYKTQLKELVQEELSPSYFVLDLHGLSQRVKKDSIIGTANGTSLIGLNSLLVKLKLALEGEGLRNIGVNEMFSASGQNTITSYTYRELKIPAMQLEIGADWRNPAVAPEKYAHLVSALCSAINAIHTIVTEHYAGPLPDTQQ